MTWQMIIFAASYIFTMLPYMCGFVYVWADVAIKTHSCVMRTLKVFRIKHYRIYSMSSLAYLK